MLNTKNMAFANLCSMSSNSGTLTPKLFPISTEHGEMNVLIIGQYKGAFRNSVV